MTAPNTLAPCPDSPNCVSSQAKPGAPHFIEPLRFTGDLATARTRMILLVSRLPRTALVAQTATWLHFTFSTAVFRWVDDVELLFDASTGSIHVRSASRVGYSDLGANRRRVELIRSRWESGR